MSTDEYRQLRAYARIDGLLLSALWSISFICYLLGMKGSILSLMLSVFLGVCSPFYAALRLRRYRDNIIGGVLSFSRGFSYSIYMFFCSSIIFALVQYIYFQFIDNGYVVSCISEVIKNQTGYQMLESYGLGIDIDDMIDRFSKTSPIDIVLGYLSTNVLLSIILSFPIAFFTKRKVAVNS